MRKHPRPYDPERGPLCSCKLQSQRKPTSKPHHPSCSRRLWLERGEALAAVRTLREYIAAGEGYGPIRYTEALGLCDRLLAGEPGPSKCGPSGSAERETPEVSS